MTDPISFTSTTPRFQLPMLFVGQAQKEFTVNEAHALMDALLHAVCEGESLSPPAAPVDGEMWIVAAGADGAWSGQDGLLAARQAGSWLFVTPREGMRLFDRAMGQVLLYRDGWKRPARPASPAGGGTIDSEARAALAGLVAALVEAGIFAQD